MGNGLSLWLALQPIPAWPMLAATAFGVGLGGGCTALGVPHHLSGSPLGGLRVSGVSQAEPPMVALLGKRLRDAQRSEKKKTDRCPKVVSELLQTGFKVSASKSGFKMTSE